MTFYKIKLFLLSAILLSCGNENELEIRITDFDFEIETEGYYLDDEQAAIEIDAAVYDTLSDYQKTFIRNITDVQEQKLISIAESLYPDRQTIIDLAENTVYEVDHDEENLWSYVKFDGVRVPYATARSAIEHYGDLIDSYREGDPVTEVFTGAELRYEATAVFKKDYTYEDKYDKLKLTHFKNVYVVDLELNLSCYCFGNGKCGVSRRGTRTVVFDLQNHSVSIYGDGQNHSGFH